MYQYQEDGREVTIHAKVTAENAGSFDKVLIAAVFFCLIFGCAVAAFSTLSGKDKVPPVAQSAQSAPVNPVQDPR